MSREECRELISSADKDEDGCMSFFEFVIMVNCYVNTAHICKPHMGEFSYIFDFILVIL